MLNSADSNHTSFNLAPEGPFKYVRSLNSREVKKKMEVDKTERLIIFDTDMGTDDAWALYLLLRAELKYEHIKVVAITCVHGNTSLNFAVRNTYRILSCLNRTDVSRAHSSI